MGHDLAAVVRHAPGKYVAFDDCGWIGLSGEKNLADLNMALVVQGAPVKLLNEYLSEIRSRDLSAVLIVDPSDENLCKAAKDRGLAAAGTVPVMVRKAAPITPTPRPFTVRKATRDDVATANDLTAEAFSLDASQVQRVFPPDYLSDTVETWLVEDGATPIGCGTCVRSGNTVGIYSMSTPSRHQKRGIGRAVLEHAMHHYQNLDVTTFTLEATAAGLHLYEQVGFRTVMEAPVFVIGTSTQFPKS
jgi:GNAT superfamily N-acetyltransferase